ncbi:MAG: RNA polymerase sigma factor [Vicinamibacterales bacterium]
MPGLDEKLVARLYSAAKAERWVLPAGRFRETLEASVSKAFSDRTPARREVEGYLASLHLEDLAVACACADGREAAWEHVIREHRPALYRAASALEPAGGAREQADALFGELYTRSLFRYFHGRSSLATWLRSVLARRYVDSVRSRRRLDPLPEDGEALPSSAPPMPDPDSMRYHTLLRRALDDAVAQLAPRERLRLGCYYAQQLTLAETGRLLHEHEATVSRQLARTRRAIRAGVARALRTAGLKGEEIARCFEVARDDAGTIDLDRMFAATLGRKISDPERSQ